MGHRAAEIHSNRSLPQRREALEGFKSGKYRVLVATDIAARGIDVTGIELVLNFDLPEQAEDYVHRIGRTGRAGAVGHAISFATPDQRRDLQMIERLIKKTIPLAKLPDSLPKVEIQPMEDFSRGPRRGFHSRPPSGGSGRSSVSRPSRPSGHSGGYAGRKPRSGGFRGSSQRSRGYAGYR